MKTLFPYPVLFGDVDIEVTLVEIDDIEVVDRVDPDQRSVDLSGLERSGWETAAITFSLTTPATEVAQLSSPSAVLVANCGHSNHRQSVVLAQDASDSASWVGRLELDRLDWFGRALIRGVMIAEVEGIGGRIVGEATEWTLNFDDLPKSPVSGSISIRWEDFEHPSDDARYLTRYKLDPWYLRIDPDNPVLFLNRGFEGLQALLNDRRRRPAPERALHDHARGSLAAEVWMSLFNASLDAVNLDDNGALEWPDQDWQCAVLALLLARMYPGSGREDALLAAYSARTSPDGAATLHERVFPAVSQHVTLPRLLRNGLRLLGSETIEEEES